MKRPGKIRETVERLVEHNLELQMENLELAVQLAAQRNLIEALEAVIKATAGLRERA